MQRPLRFFIGYDSKEPIAFHVAAHSILKRATCPVAIIPLVQDQLRASGMYTRKRGPTESTEFSLTRFLVPALCDFQGHAIFMDCDFLCRVDVAELHEVIERSLWERPLGSRRKAVLCCQHDYKTTQTVKFLGQVNVPYPRKNWSSFMIFDCSQCGILAPKRVNILSGLELHRFSWLKEEQLGALPLEWNYLVGETGQTTLPPKMVHFSLGGPWFKEYEDCEYSGEWFREAESMLHPQINAGVPT